MVTAVKSLCVALLLCAVGCAGSVDSDSETQPVAQTCHPGHSATDCDDGNECTAEFCGDAGTCGHLPLTHFSCEHGTGTCDGEPIHCVVP